MRTENALRTLTRDRKGWGSDLRRSGCFLSVMRYVSHVLKNLGAEVRVWESSQKLIARGSIGDDNEDAPHENGRSLHEVSESSDLGSIDRRKYLHRFQSCNNPRGSDHKPPLGQYGCEKLG